MKRGRKLEPPVIDVGVKKQILFCCVGASKHVKEQTILGNVSKPLQQGHSTVVGQARRNV